MTRANPTAGRPGPGWDLRHALDHQIFKLKSTGASPVGLHENQAHRRYKRKSNSWALKISHLSCSCQDTKYYHSRCPLTSLAAVPWKNQGLADPLYLAPGRDQGFYYNLPIAISQGKGGNARRGAPGTRTGGDRPQFIHKLCFISTHYQPHNQRLQPPGTY